MTQKHLVTACVLYLALGTTFLGVVPLTAHASDGEASIRITRSAKTQRRNTECTFDIYVNKVKLGAVADRDGETSEFRFATSANSINTVQAKLITAIFGIQNGETQTYQFQAYPESLTNVDISWPPGPTLGGGDAVLTITTVKTGNPPVRTITPALTRAEDERQLRAEVGTHFTVLVSREFNTVLGRVAPQYIYSNKLYLGKVWNGSAVRFKVPSSPNETYTVQVTNGDVFSNGVSQQVQAAAGSEVVLKTGMDVALGDGSQIRDVTVYPVGRATLRLHHVTKGNPRVLSINGRKWAIASEDVFHTYDWAPTNRLIRLDIIAAESTPHIIFTRPGKPLSLNLPRSTPAASTRVLESLAYLNQLRYCIAYHVFELDDDTGLNLEWLAKDMRLIHAQDIMPEVMALRDAYIKYFRQINGKAKSGATTVGRNLLGAALQTGFETLLLQTPPTQFDVLGQTVTSLCESGFDVYKMSADLNRDTNELKAVETAAVQMLQRELEMHPTLQKNEYVREILGSGSAR